MSASLTLQPFEDLIRHGKHARAAQSADPSPADAHANARDQRVHAPQQAEHRERERAADRDRDREIRQEHIKDKAQTKEVAEAIVKEENAAKERMPHIKGLERFTLLDKMGECVSSRLVSCRIAWVTDFTHYQRCILACVQGPRYSNRPECRQCVEQFTSFPLLTRPLQ